MDNPIAELEREFARAGAISAEEIRNIILQKRITVAQRFFRIAHQEGILPQEVVQIGDRQAYQIASVVDESEKGKVLCLEWNYGIRFWRCEEQEPDGPFIFRKGMELDYEIIWRIMSFCAQNLHPASHPSLKTYPGIYPVRMTPQYDIRLAVEDCSTEPRTLAIRAESPVGAAMKAVECGYSPWNRLNKLEVLLSDGNWREVMPVSGSWSSFRLGSINRESLILSA